MKPIRMAMVGGAPGRFICDAHHRAWRMDGLIQLVAGCFSSDPDRNRAAGEMLNIDEDRVYPSFETMIATEVQRPEADRIELICSITPNHLHHRVAISALRAGIPVITDKPLSFSLDEARDIVNIVRETNLPFCVTYTYSAYPMVQQARALIASGKLGKVRRVNVDYAQAGVANQLIKGTPEALEVLRQNTHQTDVSACMSDIGVHAAHLAETITGLRITSVAADTQSFLPDSPLDHDANVLLRLEGGARGVLTASQIAIGEENPLSIRIHTENAGLAWHQHQPNDLIYQPHDGPQQILRTGRWLDLPGEEPRANSILPAGHPEGYLEAFSVFYRKMARVLQVRRCGETPNPLDLNFPTAEEGFRGMALVQAVHESATHHSQWTSVATI